MRGTNGCELGLLLQVPSQRRELLPHDGATLQMHGAFDRRGQAFGGTGEQAIRDQREQ
jgi:hypothetical protein